MRIGVLAVQGAFVEHERILTKLGAECVELRKNSDLRQEFDGLVLPGGESTVQGKLLKELSMFEELRERIVQGLPVLATCAGLILLAETLEHSSVLVSDTSYYNPQKCLWQAAWKFFCTGQDSRAP